MNKEFEVNGVQYMAVEGKPKDLALGGFWEVLGKVKDLTLQQQKELSGHEHPILWIHHWAMLCVQHNLNDNSLIIKKI